VSASASVVVLTDANVWRWHGARFSRALAAAGVAPLVKVLAPGEATKARAVKEEVEDWMLENRCVWRARPCRWSFPAQSAASPRRRPTPLALPLCAARRRRRSAVQRGDTPYRTHRGANIG
jgi:hypothetical protein